MRTPSTGLVSDFGRARERRCLGVGRIVRDPAKRLSGYECAAILMASSRSLPPDDVAYVLSAIEEREHISMPFPPLLNFMGEATWWAEHASLNERKAVLAAAYTSLPDREQAAFLGFGAERAAA